MIAIDTNILVYAHRSATPEHERAKRAIEAAAATPGGFGFALSTICEFWSVVTHPAASGRPSSPSEAADFIRALVQDGGGCFFTPRPGAAERLLDLAVENDIKGPRVFDLAVAAAAVESGATELWTHDHGFAPIPGLKIVHPLD